MGPDIQDTLLRLFEQVRQDPDTVPVVSIDEWHEGAAERHLLTGFRDMLERLQEHHQDKLETRERFSLAVQGANDGLWDRHFDTGEYHLSTRWKSMLGYEDHEISDNVEEWHKRIHPDDVDRVSEAGQAYRDGRTDSYELEYRLRHKDGSYRWVLSRGIGLRDASGKPYRMAGSNTDITSLKLIEEQLREREEQYRSIFEAATDGLTINDLEDGHVVEANPAACQMYGYAYEEMIGLPVTATIHPDSFHHVSEVLQAIPAGGHYQARLVAMRKDGTTFHVDGRGTPFMYKGKPHLLGVIRDITEQVQAEQRLREKEEQYRSIFEATYDGLVINDLDGFCIEANPAYCRMLGYTYEELIGLHYSQATYPEFYPVLDENSRAIQAGTQFQAQGLARRKDGSPLQVEAHSTPFTYKGKPHMLGVMRDITERIQAEQQLREREEQYRSVFEATNDGLDILDPDGFIVEANPAFCSMFGYTHEELIGLYAGKLTAPQSLHLMEESRESIKEGRDIQVEGLALRKDGSVFHAEAHLTALIYQGKPHMLGVTRDITERVEAEKQLREKEEQYRGVFEATTDAMFIASWDGVIVEVNPAACKMFGYSREEFLGLAPTAIVHPDYLPVVLESTQTIQAGGKAQARLMNVRKDGTTFPTEVHGTMLMYNGKPHSMAVARDITEQVQAQQLLEQRVEERTRELSTLLEVSHNVASTLELKSLLGLILEQLKTVADYDGATVTIVDGDHLVIIDYRGYGRESLLGWRFPLKQLGLIWETICRQEVVIVEDVYGDTPLALAYRQAVGDLQSTIFAPTHTWMAIPMMLKERVMGMLNLTSRKPNYFTTRHATLALGIANQAAIAIENARLYEQAQELAAVEERQRLARELHDSVSQALYGISLGVHTARLQLDHDPGELAESLDYVLELAEAALTEMRALIFELRPESLEAEGLITALTKQAAAMQARHHIVVQLDLCSEPEVSLKVKRELYRVAQEALHNTVKHAEASKVNLRLCLVDGVVILEVRDDGKGFEATGSFPGHLGLHSMRERIESLDGALQIESAPGQGTSIRAHIPTRKTTKLTS